jgi:hypothetical protein
MRQAIVFCVVLSLASLAVGQTSVVSGYASNWVPGAVSAVPFVPLLTTPTVSLDPVTLVVGASDATAGNVAGAVNATLSINSNGPGAQFAQPVWSSTPSFAQAQAEASPVARAAGGGQGFEWGAASFQDSYGVAQLLAMSRPPKQATRTYTNPDVARLNNTNGIVKYAGKTEQMN